MNAQYPGPFALMGSGAGAFCANSSCSIVFDAIPIRSLKSLIKMDRLKMIEPAKAGRLLNYFFLNKLIF
jgi:hypothetical protein